MSRWSSYITRFLAMMLCGVLIIAVLFFVLSNSLVAGMYTTSVRTELQEGIRSGKILLARYANGEITLDTLHEQLNPALNTSGVFVMLLDVNKKVISYTDSAVPYFAGGTLEKVMAGFTDEITVISTEKDLNAPALLRIERSDTGYVLVGKPTGAHTGANNSYRAQLLMGMTLILIIILMGSTVMTRVAAKPARRLTEAASMLIDGELVALPENMPGEMREIARAFNYVSRTIAQAFFDLRYEKETLGLVLEGINEGILAMDETGEVVHQNTAVHALLGTPDTPAFQAISAALMDALRTRQSKEGKLPVGGRVLQYAITLMPQHDGMNSAAALVRDVTEQERLERTRHDYVANISHELRTPLASMRGLAEGLRDGLVTEPSDQQRYHSIIVDEVTRMSRLVNDLLELSGLQSNPTAFEMESIDPNELIYELHDRNGSLLQKKQLAFMLSLPQTDLPHITSNEDRLTQVLTIFLDNAIKYTPPGGTVTLGAKQEPSGVRFFVKDTGVGMDAETQKLAFDRFHQAERGRSDKGSGLGLSIAREILMKLGVSIDLESEPGKGSTFSFVIAQN